jgi:threonine/homoserine/homoserine lactone efflux protein
MSIMKLSAPKVVTFWIAVALAVLGLLASQGVLSQLASYAFWLVLVGFVVLALGNLLKNL